MYSNVLAPYKKSISALLGAVGVTLVSALTDGRVSTPEIVQMFAAGLMAFGVYALPNAPGAPLVKTVTAAAMVGLNLLGGWLAADQEITNAMWINLAIQVAAAAGVIILKNEPEPAVPPTADTPGTPVVV